jgi:protein-S-isoprenylcysteine O-methyltransferase Ste14
MRRQIKAGIGQHHCLFFGRVRDYPAAMEPDEIKRAWLRQSISLPIFFALLLAPAGTLNYWQAWVYGVLFAATSIGIGIYLLKKDPKAVARRMKVGPGAEQEPAQKVIMTLVLIGFVLLIVVPGFDRRWHWSSVPGWLAILANLLVVLGLLGTAVVLRQNAYAASTIRVEAGQPVASTGLYAIVRHPMYSAALLMLVFTPLALGSYWSLLLIVPMIGVLAWRLLDEERFLVRNLPGYAEYRERTRYRLIPGVW